MIVLIYKSFHPCWNLFLFGLEAGLADHDNYHAFCRLLGRFKVNYQVTLTICSLNICIQLLLLWLMLYVLLNCFLLIGNLLNLKIIYNHMMLVFIISILTTQLKKIWKATPRVLHFKSLFSCRTKTFFLLYVVFHGRIFVLFLGNC